MINETGNTKDTDRYSRFTLNVIEDNQGDFVLIEDYLLEKFSGIDIYHSTDFKSAESFLQNQKCDLILLDLHLPDLSGLQLIDQIISISSKIPIIVLTGYADLPLAKSSLEKGVYDLLVKDEVNPNLLHKSIEFALSRSTYIKRIELQNEKLRKIAWTQSHVVRAPLARMLGIMNLIKEDQGSPDELSMWLDHLKASAHELDEIISTITHEAQEI